MSIVIPRSSTILEMMIRNGASMGSDHEVITIKLPQNWYQNKNLLGFSLCCVYVPTLLNHEYNIHVFASESEDDQGALNRLYCSLTIDNNKSIVTDTFSLLSRNDFCDDVDDSVSDQMWVIHYPKDGIDRG